MSWLKKFSAHLSHQINLSGAPSLRRQAFEVQPLEKRMYLSAAAPRYALPKHPPQLWSQDLHLATAASHAAATILSQGAKGHASKKAAKLTGPYLHPTTQPAHKPAHPSAIAAAAKPFHKPARPPVHLLAKPSPKPVLTRVHRPARPHTLGPPKPRGSSAMPLASGSASAFETLSAMTASTTSSSPAPGTMQVGPITIPSITDPLYSIAVQQDGKIVVLGDHNGTFSILRYDITAKLDQFFGTGGAAAVSFSSGNDTARAVAVDYAGTPTTNPEYGKIVVAGRSTSGIVVARFNSNGTLDTTFGNAGRVSGVLAGGSANGLILGTDGNVLVGGTDANGNPVVIRLNAKGALDPTFGTTGVYSGPLTNFNGSQTTTTTTAISTGAMAPASSGIRPANCSGGCGGGGCSYSAPNINLSSCSYSATEGVTFQTSGTISDPNPSRSLSGTVNYGDGSGNQPLTIDGYGNFTLSHTYAEEASDTITISVTDSNDGGQGGGSVGMTVNDAPPSSVSFSAPSSVTAGIAYSASGSFSDIDYGESGRTYSATVDYGDGSGSQPLALSGNTFSLNHVYWQVTPQGTPDKVTVTINKTEGTQNTSNSGQTPVSVTPVNVVSPTLSQDGSTYTVTLSAGSISGQTINAWTVTWGDGVSTSASGTTSQVNHTYTGSPAGKIITVVAYDSSNDVLATFTLDNPSLIGNFGSTVPSTNDSVIALDPTAPQALFVNGNGQMIVGGNVVVDSSSSTALFATGKASLQAGAFAVHGGDKINPNATVTPTPTTNTPVVSDPLIGLTPPTPGTHYPEVSLTGGTQTILPGSYSSISVSGSGNLIMESGVYTVQGGGFSITGQGSVSGSGVAIVNTSSQGKSQGIDLEGQGTCGLTPMSSGTLQGVIFYQPSLNSNEVKIAGNAIAGISGTIYGPTATVVVTGNGQLSMAIDADKVRLQGNGQLINGGIVGAIAYPISATEGASTGNVTVAKFYGVIAGGVNSDTTATINWGAGPGIEDATISADPAGGYDVIGSTIYPEEGSYPITVNIVVQGVVTCTVGSTATVADAALTAGPLTPPSVTEGQAFSNSTVFHFTDADPAATAGDYTAQITLGDGNSVSLTNTSSPDGQIVANPNGGFDVQVSYTYAEELTNATFGVTVTDDEGKIGSGAGNITSASTSAFNVTDAALTAGALTPPSAKEGISTGNAVLFHFADADPDGMVGDYTATVNWGDGSSNTSIDNSHTVWITPASGGGFNIVGNHSYPEELNNATFSVSVADHGASISQRVTNFSVADAPLTAGALTPPTAYVGIPLSNVTVFHFADADPAGAIADYVAVVAPGDGKELSLTSSPGPYGQIVANSNGGFDVQLSYTYAAPLSNQSFTVTVSDHYARAQGTGAITVSTPTITIGSLTPPAAIEGQPLNSATVAHFAANPAGAASDFTATVTTGDATLSSTGDPSDVKVVANPNGGYDVQLSYTYAEELSGQTFSVNISGHTASQTQSASNFNVVDASLSGSGINITATVGMSTGAVPVANFTDADPAGTASDYQTTTINWGDNSSSAGSISAGANGGWVVSGQHTYSTTGSFTITTTINDSGGASTTVTSVATVSSTVSNPATLSGYVYEQLPDPNTPGGSDSVTLRLNPNTFSSPIFGAMYYAPTNQVLFLTEVNGGYEIASADGNNQLTELCTVPMPPLVDSVDVATTSVLPGNAAGFTSGDIFLPGSDPGSITKVSDGGMQATDDWVRLPSTSAVREMTFDRDGAFGGDMLAVTRDGKVWLIDAAGDYAMLADTGDSSLEAAVILPDQATNRWGSLAGTILAFSEVDGPTAYSIQVPQNTTVSSMLNDTPQVTLKTLAINYDTKTYNYPGQVDKADIIHAGMNWYGGENGLDGTNEYSASSTDLSGIQGDVVLSTDGGLVHLYWANSSLQAEPIETTLNGTSVSIDWENTSYGSAGLNGIGNGLAPVAGETVYLDQNDNGVPDSGEPTTTTDSNGSYSFTGLAAGTYNVREVVPSGDSELSPAGGVWTESPTAGQTIDGLDFLIAPSSGAIRAPVITSHPPTTVLLGSDPATIDYSVSATAPNSDPLKYELAEYPSGTEGTPEGNPAGPLLLDSASPQVIYSTDDRFLGDGQVSQPGQADRFVLRVTDTTTGGYALQPFTVQYVVPTPTNVTALSSSAHSVDISWSGIPPQPDLTQNPSDLTDNVYPNPTKYWVFRSTGTPYAPSESAYIDPIYDPATVPAGVTAIEVDASAAHLAELFERDSELTTGTTYYYTVQAEVDVNAGSAMSVQRRIYSGFSQAVSATPVAVGLQPAVPGGAQATPTDPNAITVEWQPNVDGITTGYNLYRGTTPDFTVGAASRIATDLPDTTYLDPGLGAGARYYYRVTALDASGDESAPSRVVTAETSSYTPTNIQASAAQNPDDGNVADGISATATFPDNDAQPTFYWSVVGPNLYPTPTLSFDDGGKNASGSAEFYGPGDYTFTVYAANLVGYSATASFVVPVISEPQSVSISPNPLDAITLVPGGTQQFTATAADQFGQPIAANFIWSADGNSTGSTNQPFTYTAPATTGYHPISVALANNSNISAYEQVRVVPPDTTPPTVSLAGTPSADGVGSPIEVYLSAADNVAVQSLTLTAKDPNGNTTTLTFDSVSGLNSASASASAPFTPSVIGNYLLTATATDTSGNTRSTTATLTAFNGNASQNPPSVSLTPAGTSSASPDVLTAAGNIDATLTDSAGLLSYTVAVTNVTNPNAPALVSQNSYSLSPSYPTNYDPVYTVDPTNLANGTYEVDVTATNIGGATATASAFVMVNSRVKLGNLRLSFNDLSANVGGFPVTITRTYDSLNADNFGDFGYGWNLSDNSARLVSTAQSFGNQALANGDQVWLSIGDGKREGFTFQFTQTGTDPSTGLAEGVYSFVPDAGVTDQLANTGTLYVGIDGNLYSDLIEAAGGDAEMHPFSLALQDGISSSGAYILQTPSGLTESINYNAGNSQATLASVTDRVGDTLTYSSDAITAEDPAGNTLGSVLISRNGPSDAVSSVSFGNTTINYGYTDPDGNSTEILQTVTTATGDTTSFSYGAGGAPPNYLTGITNSAGVMVLSATFDGAGRLDGLVDANHNPIQLSNSSQFGEYSQSSTDVLGFTTVNVYDANGNIIRSAKQTDAAGDYQVVVSEYDTINDQTAQSKPFMATAANYLTAQVPGYTSGDPNNPNPIDHPEEWAKQATYDTQGHVLTTTDALGRVTTYTYDGGQLSTVTGPNESIPQTQNFYSNGQLTETIDAVGDVTSYTYATSGPEQGELLSESSPDGITSYAYDVNHNMTQTIAPSGQVTTYAYDANNNVTATTSNGQTSYSYYDADNRVTKTVDASGHETDTTYVNGHVAESTDYVLSPSGFSWTPQVTYNDYDAAGNLLRTRYPDGTETISVYDVLGRVILATDQFDPNSTTSAPATRTVYNGDGQVIDSQRIAGVTISLSQSANGSWTISTVSASAGLTASGSGYTTATGFTGWLSDTSSAYNADGSVSSVTARYQDTSGNPDENQPGSFTTYSYDTDGRTTETAVYAGTNASGAKISDTTTAYDVDGRQTLVTDALGHKTSYQYDVLGHLTLTSFDNASTITDHYNAAGQKDWEKDQNGNVTSYQYDAAGNVTDVIQPQVIDPENGNALVSPATTYVYNDATGTETEQIDANNHVTSFTYDASGNQLTRTLPEVSGVATATDHTYYDSTDTRVTQTVDFDGNTASYLYDAQGRVSEIDYFLYGQSAASQVVSYQYDALGRQTQVLDSEAGTTSYAYDADGHVTQIVSPEGTVNHTYDPATGQLVRTWTGDGSLDETYAYDAAGRLATVTELNGQAVDQVTSYSYDLDGNLQTTSTNTGSAALLATYGYDDLNRLTSLVNTSGTSTLSSFSYSYDAAGHQTQVVEVGVDGAGITRTVSYTYDADSRLTSEADTVNGSTTTTSYTYDLVGNRLTATTNGTPTTSTYDARDRLTTSVTGGTTTSYVYDADGNTLQQIVNGTVSQSYTWDARGRMHTATVGGTSETYTYDDAGNRVGVENTYAGPTSFLFDDANPTGYPQVLTETGGSGTTVYAYGAQRLSLTSGTTTHMYLYDGHGSVVQLADPAANVTDRYVYDAFGNAAGPAGSTANAYRYEGMRLDGLTGLYDDAARYLQPATGRFNQADVEGSEDQLDPLTLDKYLYAQSDPVDFFDPSGHSALANALFGTAVHSYLARAFEGFTLPGVPPLPRFPAGPNTRGTVDRWGNRQIRSMSLFYGPPGLRLPRIWPLTTRPDFVEVFNTFKSGDIYELKSGSFDDILDPIPLMAEAVADLLFYRSMMTLFVPWRSWTFGTTWAPGVTVWPGVPFLPPGDTLITFNLYSSAPGAIIYDVLDPTELVNPAVAGALALALSGQSTATGAATAGAAESFVEEAAAEEAVAELEVAAVEGVAEAEAPAMSMYLVADLEEGAGVSMALAA